MSEICPAPQIPADSTDQQRSLLTCKSSVQCLSNLVNHNKIVAEENRKTLETFEKDLATYKAEKTKFLNTLDDYEKRKGDFSEYFLRDGVSRDFWANEYDGTCWAAENWDAATKWCKWAADNKGYNGVAYHAKQWGFCHARWGNFKCGKSEETVKEEQDDYKNAKPVFDKREPLQSDYPLKQILPVESVAINCCSNYMNVTGIAESNVQTCNQIIEQKLNEPVSIVSKGSGSNPTTGSNSASGSTSGSAPAYVETPFEAVPVVLVTKPPPVDVYPSSNLIEDKKTAAPTKAKTSTTSRNLIIASVLLIILLFMSSSALLAVSQS